MSRLPFAVVGSADALDARDVSVLFDRSTSSDATVRADTARIIARVRDAGDNALRDLAREFDGAALAQLEVPRARWEEALALLAPPLRQALRRATTNIRRAHEAFRPQPQELVTADGVVIGRRPDALRRVGVYAPGGRAAYPSSLLMGVVPARVAGVDEVIVCSPPDASGAPSPVVLAAAAIAGADRVFAIGGAGAVAAMAFGTQSVPAVDRIVGPGNAWVAEAKLQVASRVGIDAPAGPSELLILADGSATPAVLAREMLAQAEHDPVAAVVLVSDTAALIAEVGQELERAIEQEPRAAIIRAAFAARGGLITAPSLESAIAFANDWAAEHLLVAVSADREMSVVSQLRNAGTIFVGESASVSFGDYMTGANHVLPTGGLARVWSGLSTADFVRWTTWQRVSPSAAASLAGDVATFARAEGLPAHAAAAEQWRVR